MPASSPAGRRSHTLSSSPERHSSFLSPDSRNTELSHFEALAAAQAEHERVREAAIRAYQAHEVEEHTKRLQEQQQKIREEQRREEERIRHEERLRAEEERLRALKLKTVPQLPPEPPAPQPPATTTASASQAVQKPATTSPTSTTSLPATQQPQVNGAASSKPNPFLSIKSLTQPTTQAANPSQTKATPAVNPFAKPAAAQSQQNGLSAASKPPQTAPANPPRSSDTDRYVEIHRNLKKLRASLLEQTKTSPVLKQQLGNMRRELRKNLGQLVGERGGNKKQIATVQELLNLSLTQVPSAPADPSEFIMDPQREPVEGATHNEPQLPSLFLYLLNQFGKAVINQFIQECGGQPKTADPLGVVTAMIFSNRAYHWRGQTLIDILMAKLRVACPVLFGHRGSEKTEQGRARLGWKRGDGGRGWIPEQLHINRMQGLAVGYAAIALRDFSKSANRNPWPPARYWASLARIVNTPPPEVSNTQCVVLRSMLELYEERVLAFWGTAGLAALHKALVEFPARMAPAKSPGALALEGLAEVLKLNTGLEL